MVSGDDSIALDAVTSTAQAGWLLAAAAHDVALRAEVAEKTQRFYSVQRRQLITFAVERGISINAFTAGDMRLYMAERRAAGRKDSTLRHDIVVAKAFFKFCLTEGVLARNPLATYRTPKMPSGNVRCPDERELSQLLQSIEARWNPNVNPKAAQTPLRTRTFHSRRNYAVIAGLIDTGCRIGELLATEIGDANLDELHIAFRVTKSDEPRVVPISVEWAEVVRRWLRVRPQCESRLLFVSETGGPIDPGTFSGIFQGYCRFAGIDGVTLHSLRHYSLSALAIRSGVAATRLIAGHSSLATTTRYVHVRADVLREAHNQAAPLRDLLRTKRAVTRRRNLVR